MSKGIVRLAYALLGVMTLASFGGPFLIGAVLRGGVKPSWPPDRTVEWVTFGTIAAVIVAVLLGFGLIWLANMKQLNAIRDAARKERESRTPPAADLDRGGE